MFLGAVRGLPRRGATYRAVHDSLMLGSCVSVTKVVSEQEQPDENAANVENAENVESVIQPDNCPLPHQIAVLPKQNEIARQ